MSVDYIAGSTTDGLTLKLYRGEDMVLLAFDIDDSLKKPDFVGFGIQYFLSDSTQPRDVFNFLMFKRVRLKAKNAAKHIQLAARTSMRSPIQQFRWAHVPSVPLDGPVTNAVQAVSIFDHYGFRNRMKTAKAKPGARDLSEPPKPGRPAWWESSFDPNSYKFRDRVFFAG